MFYQSRYKNHRLVLKPGVIKEVNGTIVHVPQDLIQFVDYRFVPSEIHQEAALDKIIADGNHDLWKITDEELETAREYKERLEELNEEFAKKNAVLQKVTKPDKGVTVKKGISSTGNVGQGETDRMNLPAEEPKKRKSWIDEINEQQAALKEKELEINDADEILEGTDGKNQQVESEIEGGDDE